MMSTLELETFSNLSKSKIIEAVEINLKQTVRSFKDLVEDYDKLQAENLNYRSICSSFSKSESKCNCNSEVLTKEIEEKNDLLQQIGSALTKVLETKNFQLIDEIFSMIYNNTVNQLNISPKKEILSEENIVHDESISEIEGTPGRKSPVFGIGKKLKSNTSNSLRFNKKQCSSTCRETPEKKNVKLVFPSTSRGKGSSRLKQSRLNLMKVKSSNIVDLTCSPETGATVLDDIEITCNVKQELIDNDETILPSPTSGPVNLPQVFRSISNESPSNFRKPQTPLKFKIEDNIKMEVEEMSSPSYTQHSIDLMKHCRKSLKLPSKMKKHDENTKSDVNESVSLLQQKRSPCSPQKQPLSVNNTAVNVQENTLDASLSLLQKNKISPPASGDRAKKMRTTLIEPIYKEPTVRKKSEKRTLRGWSCEKCEQFYGALYEDDIEMLALKMDECSKHRGRNNPARPATPGGLWEPRWDVPTDTEEFNRRNNAL